MFKSLGVLKQAAREQRSVSYDDLVKANGQTWSYTSLARLSGSRGHLDRLLDVCKSQKLPLLTSLCVNKANLSTGHLDDASLAGFIAGARRLRENIGSDDRAFLRRAQQDTFVWGRSQDE